MSTYEERREDWKQNREPVRVECGTCSGEGVVCPDCNRNVTRCECGSEASPVECMDCDGDGHTTEWMRTA